MMGADCGVRRVRWNIAGGGRARGWLGAVVAGLVLTSSLARAQEPELPIREIRGAQPGPTVAFVAGVHGGKVAAVRALDWIAARLDPARMRGTVLLVGPANVAGYRAGLAQTSPSDGLNLNRVFPGRADGQPTERLAARIMREVVSRSDYLIDLHGSDGDEAVGDFAYAARPGVSPHVDSAALLLAKSWGARVIVWDEGGPRSLAESRFLQTAAHLSGVAATTVFLEGNRREEPTDPRAFSIRALHVLEDLGVTRASHHDEQHVDRDHRPNEHAQYWTGTIVDRRAVVVAPAAGAWFPLVRPFHQTFTDEAIGTLTDATGKVDTVRAPSWGLVLHQRFAAPVASGTALIIIGAMPAPSRPSRPPRP